MYKKLSPLGLDSEHYPNQGYIPNNLKLIKNELKYIIAFFEPHESFVLENPAFLSHPLSSYTWAFLHVFRQNPLKNSLSMCPGSSSLSLGAFLLSHRKSS